MGNRLKNQHWVYRLSFLGMFLLGLWGLSVAVGLLLVNHGYAAPRRIAPSKSSPKVVYEKKTSLDFEGAEIEGELKKPAEFYFQHRPEERFDSLVKRRTQFHRELLRDAVLSK